MKGKKTAHYVRKIDNMSRVSPKDLLIGNNST